MEQKETMAKTLAKTLADYIAEVQQEQEHGPTPQPDLLAGMIESHFGAGVAEGIRIEASDRENARHAAQGMVSHGGREFLLWIRREASGRQVWMLDDEPLLIVQRVERRIDQAANAQALAKRIVEKGG